ncbi:MAG TPA: CvpA family protein [Verrucomicrobiae bacterium]
MKLATFQLTWFDLVVLALVAYGIIRGRKRGMSEEILDVLQWLLIVVLGALLYTPLGKRIAGFGAFSLFIANLLAYTLVALTIKLVFSMVKRQVGEKLVHSDAFGRFEYYLGMLAGSVRCLCILIFALSFLHAKYISDAERLATAKMQQDNFGSISFPTIGSLQQSIFHESYSGQFIKNNLKGQMVKPIAGSDTPPPSNSIGRRREAAVDEVLGKR